MFDLSLNNKKIRKTSVKNLQSIPSENISKIVLMDWEEHCVECAVPYCYQNCSIYKERKDLKCVRLEEGIVVDKNYVGELNYGIRCIFRKWAKLEAYYSGVSLSRRSNINIAKIDNFFTNIVEGVSTALKPISPSMKLLGAYNLFKRSILNGSLLGNLTWKPDCFYIECFLINKEDVQLMVQASTTKEIIYSKIFVLQKGQNKISIPFEEFSTADIAPKFLMFMSPLSETNTEIVFTWASFIKYNQIKETKETKVATNTKNKIKCVAWDLDNTLWKGTLTEDGAENLILNTEAVKVIQELDSRGILNTIVSKNDHENTIKVLQHFGILDYFLYPAINWGQKSENLKLIAKKLNIGIDTFAFVDDNIREIEEVKTALPEVLTLSDKEIGNILSLPEVDVPITELSKQRRASYINEISREELKGQFTSNYDQFLLDLHMKLFVYSIESQDDYDRSLELLLRSNQLNLSTNRYTKEEFDNLINGNGNLCLCFKCSDRFGDYGQIGFISLKLDGTQASIIDFVISCRVAKKKVENAIVYSLKNIFVNHNITSVRAKLIKTKKNIPLADVFNELPFDIKEETSEFTIYEINDLAILEDAGIIETIYNKN